VELARAIQRVFPGPDDVEWVYPDHGQTRKRYQYEEVRLPMLIRHMLREFNSQQFMLFLETLTGIENLIADPYFIGGGAHLSGRGDFLKAHADFNWHHKLQVYRRVNALWYLSDEWDESWGGHWSSGTRIWHVPWTGHIRTSTGS
jgi:Rps23 Pro-64 3,4-dihydroxylase Tpa1-like proline 4-hydroxylase